MKPEGDWRPLLYGQIMLFLISFVNGIDVYISETVREISGKIWLLLVVNNHKFFILFSYWYGPLSTP